MALKAVYERFLASPNPLSLTENASLYYVTTLISYTQPGPIIKHLETQTNNIVKTKSAKIIGVVEGDSSIAVEVDTTLEFISGGGAFLPGLENFIVDKIATIPISHIVHFNHEQKITQIRINWDQGSLLKQTDVIGSRGRNWPVFDGKDQIRIITSSATAAAAVKSTPPTSPRGRGTTEKGFAARNASPTKKYIKDPHASLDLFVPQEADENRALNAPSMPAPRSSAKPPPREMSELFAAGHEDYEAQPGESPKKLVTQNAIAPKGAGSQKFQPSRLFDQEEEVVKASKIYHTNPARYNHFDIGDEIENDAFQYKTGGDNEKPAIPLRAKTNKHMSQWDFQDFVTPAKPGQKVRDQDIVHIKWNQDESGDTPDDKAAAHRPRRDADTHFEIEDDGTPVDRPAVPKPRKDAQTHFEFNDQPTPAAQRLIGRTNMAKGLYRNVLEEDNDDIPGTQKGPLAAITNNAGRKNDFDSHWNFSDSPSTNSANNENKDKNGQKKAIQMMGSRWDTDEPSPEAMVRPATKQFKKGLESHWDMADEDEQPKHLNRHAGEKNYWDF